MEYSYSNKELLEMYDGLVKSRIFALKMQESVQKGNIRTSFHSPYGEESVGVGVVSAVKKPNGIGYVDTIGCKMLHCC